MVDDCLACAFDKCGLVSKSLTDWLLIASVQVLLIMSASYLHYNALISVENIEKQYFACSFVEYLLRALELHYSRTKVKLL